MPFLRRELIAIAFFIIPNFVIAQWPLHYLGYDAFQNSVPDQSLLAKVKFSTRHFKSALYNQINRLSNPDINIDGLSRADYRSGMCEYIGVLRNDGAHRLVIIRGTSGDYGRDFETDQDDNYLVLGDNADEKSNTQLFIHKVDVTGKTLWRRLYGGSGMEYAVNIAKAGDGNFIVLAQSQSADGDVVVSKGGTDIWLLKINGVNGDIMWQKTFGSEKNEIPTHLEILSDGSMMISGSAEASSFAPSSYAGMNAFLMKLDNNLNIKWVKAYGGNGDDAIKSFTPTDDGGFASIGTSTSSDGSYPVNLGGRDIYIFKYDSTGDISWSKHYGNKDDDQAGDVIFISCDSKIFASYAKQYSYDAYYYSNPPYPLFSQNAGVQIGIYNDGTQFYYHEDNFKYSKYDMQDYEFNEQIYPTMAPNHRGGFIGGNLGHLRFADEFGTGSLRGIVTRSFLLQEYGSPFALQRFDTTICEGESVWGKSYYRDTTFSDTSRNRCNVDTLVKQYNIKVISTKDSLIFKDTSVCRGQPYRGQEITTSFVQYDTLVRYSKCGSKNIITKTNIFVPPLIGLSLGGDTLSCTKSWKLKASYPGATYLWQDGSKDSTLIADSAGLYWAEVTDSYGCKERDSINIRFSDLYLDIFHDTTILDDQSILLNPATNGTVTWKENNNLSCLSCQSTVATPPDTTVFYIGSAKEGCLLTDSVKVNVEKDTRLFIPSAFTPNMDGKNDRFKVVATSISDYKILLFNRWGEVVFQSDNLANGWDGTFKGESQPAGIYVYLVFFKDIRGKMHKQRGTLMLLR